MKDLRAIDEQCQYLGIPSQRRQQFQESFTQPPTVSRIGMESGLGQLIVSHISSATSSNPDLSTERSHLSVPMEHEVIGHEKQCHSQLLDTYPHR